MSNNKFKILAIDGSGREAAFKDLYSARILQQFETALQQKHNDYNLRLVDYFDMVCGIPSGGLTALALSLRKPMGQVCSFYEEHGAKILPSSNNWYKKAKQGLFRSQYSNTDLKLIYGEFFEDHELGDSDSLLCIPTYDFTQSTTHESYGLFKYDHDEANLDNSIQSSPTPNNSIQNHISYLDVSLNSSAAPVYSLEHSSLAPKHITQDMDPVAWANNPSLAGLMEARKYFVGRDKPYNSIQMLSIASLDTSSIAQSKFTESFLSTFTSETEIPLDSIRIPSCDLSSEQENSIAVENASDKSISLINKLGNTVYHNYKEDKSIKDMFSTKKTYQTSRLQPLEAELQKKCPKELQTRPSEVKDNLEACLMPTP